LAGSTPGGASTLTSSDGYTSLTTIGTVTLDTPYTSGQNLVVQVEANPVMDEANLAANSAPTSGNFYFAECTDPGGLAANLPTAASGCESATISVAALKSSDGSATLEGAHAFTVYNLPDPTTLGPPTMTGECNDGIDPCVVGMFAASPTINGFSYPHLFSAPFYVSVGDGMDLGDNPGDGSPLPVTTTSASNSTVVATPTSVTADGVGASQITVTLEDTNGVPVTTGKQVTLTPLSGSSVVETGGVATSTGTTDSNGQIEFSVTDLTTESVTYMATDVTDSLPLVAEPQVTFVAPAVTAANSSVVANPSVVAAANGTDSSTVTVTLDDQGSGGSPQPVANKVVTLSQGGAHSVITPATDTTNATGEATFSVTDTTPEVVTYTATDTTDGIPLTGQSASVTFGTLSASSSASTITTTTPIVSSVASTGGQQPLGTVVVSLVAADGTSPVAGKTVVLSASSTTAQITPNSEVTGTNGTATFSVSDTSSETVTFTAEDTTDSVSLAASVPVEFEVPAASATTSEMSVSNTSVPADGTTEAAIVVTINDQFGEPLEGKTVTIVGDVTGTGTPSANVKIPPSTDSGGAVVTTTNGSGQITFDTLDTTAESVTYTATDTTDGVVVKQTVEVSFTAGLPQVSQSSVQASPASVAADGSTASTITVTLDDHNDNPVPNITVTLSALNGSSTISPATAVTNTSGIASFNVTDQTAEIVVYRATDTTDDLPLVGEEVTVTFGTPQPVAPVAADSAIVANTTSVPADGSSSATITVFLNDSNGNPLINKEVSLVPSAGRSTVAPSTGTTDSDGTVAFMVTDKTAETVSYTVMDITDNVLYSGLSVTITFSPSSGSGSTIPSGGASSSGPSLGQPIVGMSSTSDGRGYWEVSSDGGIGNYGDAVFRGSAGGVNLDRPIAGMAPLSHATGYWLADADGQVFPFGDAASLSPANGLQLNKPIVGIAATPDGKGYWLVASDGGIFAYGDAGFYGSAGGIQLNKPIVGMAATPDGKGYWLVASDGGIFAYGDAFFYGSTGSLSLNSPIVGMASSNDGGGYWLVAADGGVFAYGDAKFMGSAGGSSLGSPIVGMSSNQSGKGYWLVAVNGDIFPFGDDASYGPAAG
jgi:5-hydroxyisourate hydrolase-like protein (transthyretin family)